MAEENKTQNPAADTDKIEKLEFDIKTAFKDGDFEKVRTLAEEIKKIDLEKLCTIQTRTKRKTYAMDKIWKIGYSWKFVCPFQHIDFVYVSSE